MHLAVLRDFVLETEFRDRKDTRFETLANELASDFEACEIRARRSVTDQVLDPG